MPEISVILTHYGHREYIHDAIHSIVNQTFTDWELIIVNDEPGFNLTYYTKYDSRIRVIEPQNRRGQAYRLNLGIEKAKGKYIAFHDADDISFPKRLEMSLDFLKEHNADAIVADNIYVDHERKRHYSQCPDPTLTTIRKRSMGGFGSILIKKSIAEQVKFKVGLGYGNDRIWSIGIMSITQKIYRMPITVYLYRHYSTTYWNYRLKKIPVVRKLYRLGVKWRLRKIVNKELKKYNYTKDLK